MITALDGQQALKYVRESGVDLALIDIMMPGINGVETFKEIKKLSPCTAVIMMTAFAVEDLVTEALQEGAYAMIYKPFDLKRILGMIEDCLSGPLILIVDDHQGARESLKEILRDRGCKITTVESGYEAIEKVKEKRYEIIFLDVVMPDLNGEDTFIAIKKINPKASVIMYSGYPVEKVLKRCLEKGAHAILYKPYKAQELVKIVEEVISQKKHL